MNQYQLQQAIKYGSKYQEHLIRLKMGEDESKIYDSLFSLAKNDTVFCLSVLKNNELYNIKHSHYDFLIHNSEEKFDSLCISCKETFERMQVNHNSTDEVAMLYFGQHNINGKYDQLIRSLDTILYDDQYYRVINVFEADSIYIPYRERNDDRNFLKIEKIINQYPRLSKREVGSIHANTVWLVLHHMSDCELRKQYLPYLENLIKLEGIEAGSIDLYLNQTNRICNQK